jgi:hypothetical protein
MGLSLEESQLLSLASTTFLYGASRKCLDSPPVFPYKPMDRLILLFVSRHVCCYVSGCDGGYSSPAHEDSSCIILDAFGGHHGMI